MGHNCQSTQLTEKELHKKKKEFIRTYDSYLNNRVDVDEVTASMRQWLDYEKKPLTADVDIAVDFLNSIFDTRSTIVSQMYKEYSLLSVESSRDYIRLNYEKHINLKRYLNNYRPTIYYFTAEWCSNCKTIKPLLKQVAADRQMTIREIDIGKWKSEADKSLMYYCRKSGRCIHALPYVVIYKNKSIIYNGLASGFLK